MFEECWWYGGRPPRVVLIVAMMKVISPYLNPHASQPQFLQRLSHAFCKRHPHDVPCLFFPFPSITHKSTRPESDSHLIYSACRSIIKICDTLLQWSLLFTSKSDHCTQDGRTGRCQSQRVTRPGNAWAPRLKLRQATIHVEAWWDNQRQRYNEQ